MSSSGSIVSFHKLTAQEELLFLRGEGRRKDLKDPLLDFGENSQIVVPYLKYEQSDSAKPLKTNERRDSKLHGN